MIKVLIFITAHLVFVLLTMKNGNFLGFVTFGYTWDCVSDVRCCVW